VQSFLRRKLKRHAAEEVDELDHQDDDHGDLEEEGAALVELVHHEAVELLGGADLAGDQLLVVGHAHLQGCQLVNLHPPLQCLQ
jgi:hypothetical protein